MTTYKYEVVLNLNEQRMALVSLADSLNQAFKATKRKRNLRDSEKAMALSSIRTKQIAVQMAVDRIDAQLKAQAGEAMPEGHYPERHFR